MSDAVPPPPDFSVPPDKFRNPSSDSTSALPGAGPSPGVGRGNPLAGADTVGRGFLFGLLLHLLQIPLAFMTAGIGFFAIGLSQLLYMVPFYIYFNRHEQPMRAKGLLICAGITFLLNAACFGALIVLLSNADFR